MFDFAAWKAESEALFARTPDVVVRRGPRECERYSLNADNPRKEWVVRTTWVVGGGATYKETPLGVYFEAVDRDAAYQVFLAWIDQNVKGTS